MDSQFDFARPRLGSILLNRLAPSMGLAIASFHVAWLVPRTEWLMLGFFLGLLWLTDLPSARASFYAALATGLGCYGPHLAFFYTIFGPPALLLWGLLALWPALFVIFARAARKLW
jgi:hypothetical protein